MLAACLEVPVKRRPLMDCYTSSRVAVSSLFAHVVLLDCYALLRYRRRLLEGYLSFILSNINIMSVTPNV